MNKLREVWSAAKGSWLPIASTMVALLAIASVGFGVLIAKTSSSYRTLAEQSIDTHQSKLFIADRLERKAAESEAIAISLEEATPCDECSGKTTFTFVVKNKLQGTNTRFTIQNETAQIDDLYIVGSSRAVVLGSVSGTLRSVNVVNTDTGSILDYFNCYFPSLSRDGRFLAYVKSAPRFSSAQEWSYVYLVYDLTNLPAQNRLANDESSSEDRTDVGTPVYPARNLNRRTYTSLAKSTLADDDSLTHIIASDGLFWISDDVLVFVDRWKKVNSLVIADLSSGIEQARVKVQRLNTTALVDMKSCNESINAPENLIRATNITFSKSKRGFLTLIFEPRGRCLTRSTLDIRYP